MSFHREIRSTLVIIGGLVAGCGQAAPATFTSGEGLICQTTTEAVQAQILAPSCGAVGCHGGSSPALGLDLTSPGLERRIIDSTANGCGDKILVVAGDASRSYLFVKLQEDAPQCGDHMPLGGKPLAATQIDCLKAWVNGLSTAGGAGAGGQSSSSGGGASPGGGAGPGNPSGGADATISSGGSSGLSTSSGGSSGAAATSGGSAGAMTSSGGSGGTATGSGGQVGCGPTVSFSSQVQPIFTTSCANAGCHTGTRPAAKLTLASGSSYADLVNVAASSCSSSLRVKPSAVSQSYLVNKLLGQNLCSGSQMPKAGSSLPSASLAAISGWICEGAPKN